MNTITTNNTSIDIPTNIPAVDVYTPINIKAHSNITYCLHTFGCKVNTCDSGLLQQNFKNKDIKKSEYPQVHIINSCAVTGEATKVALHFIRRLKKINPLSKIVVTGCGAQVDTDEYQKCSFVDLIVANSHKEQLFDLIKDLLLKEENQKIFKSNIFLKTTIEAGGEEESHTRAFVKIQDGCNSFCSYCVVPFARGRSRSLSRKQIVERIRELQTKGVNEVVLTGVHIGDYKDKDYNNPNQHLEDLIENILNETNLSRLRLTSLEPIEISQRLLNLFYNQRLCPHFHLSIQSASNTLLKRMNRRYSAEEVESVLSDIAKMHPHAFVGMDLIVGFPGETNAEFDETYELLSRNAWTNAHIFPYSNRPGTKASTLNNLNPCLSLTKTDINRRISLLRSLSSEHFQKARKLQIGKTKDVLVLKNTNKNSNNIFGLSKDYWKIHLPSNASSLIGKEITTTITTINCKGDLIATLGLNSK